MNHRSTQEESVQTVTVNLQYDQNNPTQFSAPIFVDFIPDEIILKSFSIFYFDNDPNAIPFYGMFSISSNLIPTGTLITFPIKYDIVVIGANEYDQGFTMFKTVNYRWLNKSKMFINGNYSFYLNKVNNLGINFIGTNELHVSLTFEFVQHAKK
jgi:hypothetical protein